MQNHYHIVSIIIAILSLIWPLTAQQLVYKDTIYDPDIKTVVWEKLGGPEGSEMAIVGLNNGSLLLSFDDLGTFEYDYYYEIIHCTRDWRPSPQLQENDYLVGFNGELIENYQASQAVYSHYIHYDLTLPNEFTGWLLSGNYVLNVYADNEEQSLILTRRFVVVEDFVPIDVIIKRPIDILKVRGYVEMDVDINLGDFDVFDPRRELTLDIIQNNNWQTRRRGLIGQTFAGDIWRYNYTDSLTFKAYKEFRQFDIRPLNFTTEFVSTIDLDDVGADVYLFKDQSRNYKPYIFDIDINGNRIIAMRDNANHDLWGEYANVTFTLEFPEIFDGDIYILGELSDWDIKESYKMWYTGDNTYKTTVPLKQGYYNYLYGVKMYTGELDIERLEGSSRETENSYTFLVYYSQDEARYDRCIGYLHRRDQ